MLRQLRADIREMIAEQVEYRELLYQMTMRDILAVPDVPDTYVLDLGPEECAAGRQHLADLGVDFTRPIVGLNTGAGGRWELKQWREDGFVELMARLGGEMGAQFVLLGGPGERDRRVRGVPGDEVDHDPRRLGLTFR